MKTKNYPYQNRSLEDIKGEKWEAIPGYEEYYLVSDYGRIKSLKKYIEFVIPGKHVVSYWKPERILSQGIVKKWNSFSKEYVYRLTVTLCVKQQMNTIGVARLVYGAFVEKIDFTNDQLYISNKDGDGRNNMVENLYSGEQAAIAKDAYQRNRLINLKPYITPKVISKSGKSRRKIITQYDLNGNRIKVYPGINIAAMETGIQHGNISRAAKGKNKQMGGFIWRYGKGKKKIEIV